MLRGKAGADQYFDRVSAGRRHVASHQAGDESNVALGSERETRRAFWLICPLQQMHDEVDRVSFYFLGLAALGTWAAYRGVRRKDGARLGRSMSTGVPAGCIMRRR